LAPASGTDQNNLITALRSFNLIDDDQRVMSTLVELAVTDEALRKERLATLLRIYYAKQLEISDQHGTEKQLQDSLREEFALDSPETRRKAMTFFLHAARTADLPLSTHFPATRSGSGSPGASRAKRTTKRRAASGTGGRPEETPPGYN
jgi:hypothetical protein